MPDKNQLFGTEKSSCSTPAQTRTCGPAKLFRLGLIPILIDKIGTALSFYSTVSPTIDILAIKQMIESAPSLAQKPSGFGTREFLCQFTLRRLGGMVLAWAIASVVAETPVSAAPPATDTDVWYSIEFEGQGVGYERVQTHRIPNSNPPTWSCFRKTQLHVKRIGQDFSLNASLWTEQLKDGRLLKFSLERLDGDNHRLQRTGTLDKVSNVFFVSELRTGSRREYKIDAGVSTYSPIVSTWMPGIVGPTRRRVTTPVFFPEADGTANIVSEYRASQRIKHAGQLVTVSRQNFYSDGDPSKLTTLSISGDGQTVRQEKRVFGGVLALVEAPASVALRSASHSIDIDSQALIPVDRLIRFSSTQTVVRLALSVSAGFLPSIPTAKFQQVESTADTEVVIALAMPELSSRSGISVANRKHTALASSVLIPLQDAAVRKLAIRAAGPENDPLRICKRLEDFVHNNMKRSSFSTSIIPASEVARTLRGDCTEHAVLLTTMMRVKGVPARVASGLIQAHSQFGFQGHTWVEALLDDEWIPFDSTSDRKAPRIKLADSELPDSASGGISLFLPVLELAGRARIRVLRDDEETTRK